MRELSPRNSFSFFLPCHKRILVLADKPTCYHVFMANTQEILKAATELGKLIATHDAAKKVEGAIAKLQADIEAQRLLNDFNRAVQAVSEKEAQGKPIEVAEKHKLQEMQNKVVRNTVLRDFQMAQMDYLDLMRKVDDAMSGQQDGGGAGQQAQPDGDTGGLHLAGM